jgi:uncharacterized protein (DUF1684 family)
MKRSCLVFLLLFQIVSLVAQEKSYDDSLQAFREKYIKEHEVIKDKEQAGLRFFPIDQEYAILSRLVKVDEAPWFQMETSGPKKKVYRVYGILHFMLKGKPLKLQVLQSRDLLTNPEYANYLLIAFTDKTSGEDTYENGRYIDATINEMGTGNYLLDFNKAYNPYCAYVSNKYNCPVPPKENELPVAIKAGEKKFSMKD